jgi:hypothetical protein
MDNQFIVEPNAQAVRLLQEGSFEQAALVLRDVLKKILAGTKTITDHETTSRHIQVYNVPVSELVDSKEHSAFFLYAQAFMFNENEQERLISSQHALATLFYNLALSQHLRGLHSDKSQKARLQFSLRMYNQAIQCLAEVPSTDVNSLPMRLAILNNKAHIYSIMYERNGLQQCLQYMEALLADVPEGFERDDYYQFHMNILIFDSKSCVLSAPAA